MRLRTPEFLHSAWTLARPYWFSEDRRAGCGLLALIVALNLGLVYLNVLFNDWNNAFYTALQDKDTAAFWQQIVRFSWLAALFILAAVYQLYFSQMLQIRWRAWLTRQFLGDWLGDRVYYRLQLGEQPTDNPDQRIAEDLRLFVSQTLTLSLGLLSSLVTLVSFITILWQLSGILHFTLWGHQLQLPGSMVWAALVYAVVGTWLTSGYGQIAVIYPTSVSCRSMAAAP
jgi:putative ATP-binding cassette transporter